MRRLLATALLALAAPPLVACEGGEPPPGDPVTAARRAAVEARMAAAREAQRAAREAAQRVAAAERAATEKARRAADLVGSIKAELDEVYRTDRAYDLDVTRRGASADHAVRLAAMPHVTVGDVTVGYEQSSTLSLRGVAYARHFRATWRRGDEDVIVSYATQEQLDAVAFAALVEKLVPIVDRALR